MKINRFCLVLVLISVLIQSANAQSIIEGHLIIDTEIWSPTAYLSIIPDFTQMNTMAVEMIIDQTKIDSSGYFSFNTKFLPQDDHLYRIHISKLQDPSASLSIGGKDENHIFFIANRQSSIVIRDTSSIDFIKNSAIYGFSANKGFQEINQIASYVDSIDFIGSPMRTELVSNAINEKLRIYADTCSIPLVALYALYKSQFEKNYPLNQQYYNKFNKKWKNEKSAYFVEFRKKIPNKRKGSILIYLSLGTALFTLGYLTRSGLFKHKEKNKNVVKDLTNQERKILLMVREGKSNKEISEELSIGLSTVKSHVYNIYSKLDIKTRKDIFNMNLERD